jgi:hypothetical protein
MLPPQQGSDDNAIPAHLSRDRIDLAVQTAARIETPSRSPLRQPTSESFSGRDLAATGGTDLAPSPLSLIAFPQYADQHRPERPVLLAVDQ